MLRKIEPEFLHHTSHITHHTSHITNHTSQITHHTSHITHALGTFVFHTAEWVDAWSLNPDERTQFHCRGRGETEVELGLIVSRDWTVEASGRQHRGIPGYSPPSFKHNGNWASKEQQNGWYGWLAAFFFFFRMSPIFLRAQNDFRREHLVCLCALVCSCVLLCVLLCALVCALVCVCVCVCVFVCTCFCACLCVCVCVCVCCDDLYVSIFF